MENHTRTKFGKSVYYTVKEDVTHKSLCSPCREEGTNVDASFRCVNCRENFCKSCVKLHNRILKSHTLVEKWCAQTESTDGNEEALLEITCDRHPLEILKMFCENHDTVCCTVCIALEHRACDGIHYVPSIAKEINERKLRDETIKSMDDTAKDLECLLSKKQRDIENLGQQRHCVSKTIDDLTNKLIARVKELQKETSTTLQTKYEKVVQDLQNDVTSLQTTLDRLKVIRNKFEMSKFASESQMFVQIKTGKIESVEARKQCEKMKENLTSSLDFELNTEIETYLKQVESLGYISNKRKSKASLVGEFDIGLQSETKNPNIYGVCLLENNEIVVADNNNLKLKRIGTEYQILDWLDLGATPYGICKTGHSEVAVTFPWLHKIQSISIGRKMVVNGSFTVDGICRGICCHNGVLYICCSGSGSDDPGHVIVSDRAGCLVRIIKTNKNGECLFTSPQNICFTGNDSCIHIADIEKGAVTVDQDGSLISITSDPKLRDTVDICTDDYGKMFLCGFKSCNVIQVDRNGKNIHEILGQTDLSTRPLTVSYLRKPPRLLITSEGSNILKVFRLD